MSERNILQLAAIGLLAAVCISRVSYLNGMRAAEAYASTLIEGGAAIVTETPVNRSSACSAIIDIVDLLNEREAIEADAAAAEAGQRANP